VLGPVMLLASVWLLFRGHDAVGGGFIGGLVAGAAVVLRYLSHGHAEVWHRRSTRTVPTVAVGVLIAAGYGLAGLAISGAFLAGGRIPLPVVDYVAASLVFDIGVYLVVVGLVAAIVRHLGQGVSPHQLPSAEDDGGDGGGASEASASENARGSRNAGEAGPQVEPAPDEFAVAPGGDA
jgi:multisubunit Na+/H+ antiporter MnhB subunit